MTLVALLTDLIFKRFGIDNLDDSNGEKSVQQIKHKLFEDLLEPMEPDEKPYSLNYSTFKFSADRQKRWNEMYNYFVKFVGNLLMDVGQVSSQTLNGQNIPVQKPAKQATTRDESSLISEEDSESDEQDKNENNIL